MQGHILVGLFLCICNVFCSLKQQVASLTTAFVYGKLENALGVNFCLETIEDIPAAAQKSFDHESLLELTLFIKKYMAYECEMLKPILWTSLLQQAFGPSVETNEDIFVTILRRIQMALQLFDRNKLTDDRFLMRIILTQYYMMRPYVQEKFAQAHPFMPYCKVLIIRAENFLNTSDVELDHLRVANLIFDFKGLTFEHFKAVVEFDRVHVLFRFSKYCLDTTSIDFIDELVDTPLKFFPMIMIEWTEENQLYSDRLLESVGETVQKLVISWSGNIDFECRMKKIYLLPRLHFLIVFESTSSDHSFFHIPHVLGGFGGRSMLLFIFPNAMSDLEKNEDVIGLKNIILSIGKNRYFSKHPQRNSFHVMSERSKTIFNSVAYEFFRNSLSFQDISKIMKTIFEVVGEVNFEEQNQASLNYSIVALIELLSFSYFLYGDVNLIEAVFADPEEALRSVYGMTENYMYSSSFDGKLMKDLFKALYKVKDAINGSEKEVDDFTRMIATPFLLSNYEKDFHEILPFLKMGFCKVLSFYDKIFNENFYEQLEVEVLIVSIKSIPHGCQLLSTFPNWLKNILVNQMVILSLDNIDVNFPPEEFQHILKELKRADLPVKGVKLHSIIHQKLLTMVVNYFGEDISMIDLDLSDASEIFSLMAVEMMMSLPNLLRIRLNQYQVFKDL